LKRKKMFQDKLIFGALSGVAANVIMKIPQYILWKLKMIRHPLSHYAASLFSTSEAVHSLRLGTLIGIIACTVYCAFLGIVFVYLLHYTGKRFFIAKGLIYGAFLWVFSYGGLCSSSLVKLSQLPKLPEEIILFLLLHLVFGIALGGFAQKFDKRLE